MGNIKYINAGAGSGKTYKLTHDLADDLKNGKVRPSEIILTTFTDAAANEFRERARAVLLESGKPELAAELGSAAIGTVHSVCQKFVKKFWFDLGLSPEMDVITDDDKDVYINQSIADITTEDDLKFFESVRDEFDIKKKDGEFTVNDHDFWKTNIQFIISAMSAYDIQDLQESINRSCDEVMSIFTESSPSHTHMDRYLNVLKNFKINVTTWDNARNTCREVKRHSQLIGYYKLLATAAIFNANKGVLDQDATIHEAEKLLLDRKFGELICECIRRTFEIAKKWRKTYEDFKREEHLLDFDDMEQYFLRLLTDPHFEEQRKEIATYKLVMVDEFQDSNPVQVRIFEALASIIAPQNGLCKWVGDPKQSIYGFRGADTDLIIKVTGRVDKDKPLDTSFRSRPELVDLVNKCFTDAFKGIVDDSMIRLEFHDRSREELKGVNPLRHWHVSGNKDKFSVALAHKIKAFVDEGNLVCEKKTSGQECGTERPVKYGDIAVLCRVKSEVSSIVSALRAADIPVSATTTDLFDWAEIQLVFAILKYISAPYSAEARASILHLLENRSTESLFVSRLNYLKSMKDGDKDSWLVEDTGDCKSSAIFPILDDIAGRVASSNIQDMISTIILELGLYDVVCHWKFSNSRIQNLGTLESLACQYEQHCDRMHITSTISGFMTWLSDVDLSHGALDNTSDAVKVMTYHKSKGLEWKVVILCSLNKDFASEKTIFMREYSSIKPLPADSENYYIHFVPAIYGAHTIPEFIIEKVNTRDSFLSIRKKTIDEEKRLMYVGMTRARDYLVTTSNKGGKKDTPTTPETKTLTDCEIGQPRPEVAANTIKLWTATTTNPVLYTDITGATGSMTVADEYIPGQTSWKEHALVQAPMKRISPSKVKASDVLMNGFTANAVKVSGYMNHKIKDVTGCGTCIHNIYAAYAPGEDAWNKEMAAAIIAADGFKEQLIDPDAVILAEDKLFDFLKASYGEATEILREVPFTYIADSETAALTGITEGQVIHGEIDLIWKTDKGAVLIDYKSYASYDEDINAEAVREHYTGYLPQLLLYKAAMISANLDVIDTMIYYPIQGRVVKFVKN